MSIPSATLTSESAAIPEQQQQQQPATTGATSSAPAPVKRSSRRANTAERRATHNAVERARRETLNGRFLDLAAILPNLASVRRPSKSAIVNSSIALVQNQRRARIIAAREARLLIAENNALRQELNEWRQRNSLPRVEEPPRSADLISLLNIQVEKELAEVDAQIMTNCAGAGARRSFDGADNLDDDEYNDDGEEETLISPDSAHPLNAPSMAMPLNATVSQKLLPTAHYQQQQQQQQQQQAQLAAQQQQLYEQQKAVMARAQQMARYTTPLNQQQPSPPHHFQQPIMYTDVNGALFTSDMYGNADNTNNIGFNNAQTWSQKAIAANSLATPPSSAHGLKAAPSSFASAANSAFLSTSPYGGSPLGIFKPNIQGGSVNGEDDNASVSEGSSHFSTSEMSMMGTSPVDHPFSYGLGMNGVMSGYNVNMMPGMNMAGMTMPPSPPNSVSISPAHSQPQSRRQSLAPGYMSLKTSPSPPPLAAQFGLVM